MPLLIDSMTVLDLAAAGILILVASNERKTFMCARILGFMIILVAVAVAGGLALLGCGGSESAVATDTASSSWGRWSTPSIARPATAPT
jgi:hypothetical protein